MIYKGEKIFLHHTGVYSWRKYKNGKCYQVYSKNKDELIKKIKNCKIDIKNNKVSNDNNITLKKWIETYQQLYFDEIKYNTKINYISRINKLILSPLWNMDIKKINKLDILTYIKTFKNISTQKTELTFLKLIFKKALINEIIKSNPTEYIKIKKIKKEKIILTKKEQTLFIEELKKYNDEIFNYFFILLNTGMRKNELRALTISDIDFNNNFIIVSKSINSDNSISSTKNGKIRKIPLFKTIKPIFENYKNKLNNNELIFKKSFNYYILKFNNIKNSINKDITIHSLRHTFASNCNDIKIDPKIIQKWLGHSNLDITLNIYTHINNEQELKSIDAFNNYTN